MWSSILNMITLICGYCGKTFEKDTGEYNWHVKRGRTTFYCCQSCSAKASNSKHIKYGPRTQVCKFCGRSFYTESKFSVKFCSRQCASAGSITDDRRRKMSEGGKYSQQNHPSDVCSIQKLLKTREHSRYAQLENLLSDMNIVHEFEHVIEQYVYDLYLVLCDTKVIIEFDEDYHKSVNQIPIDITKTNVANSNGYKLYRVNCEVGESYSLNMIKHILDEYLK